MRNVGFRMIQSDQIRRSILLIGCSAIAGALAAWGLSTQVIENEVVKGSAQFPFSKGSGDARLISYEPLPPMGCDWPAGTLMAGTFQRGGRDRLAPNPSDREPLRVIRDPYASLSAVAVDMERGEVVATDENLFQILVYDRLDSTPPTAAMTEPKRTISGPKTQVEFNCSLYIDPTNGEIYGVNNDTKNKLVIFSRQAEGDVAPDRWLHTPHGTFGIAMDEENEEFFLTVQHDSAVVVYRKTASEEEPPVRLIQGDKTLLADPHGIVFDPKNNLIFVTNFGSAHSVGQQGLPSRTTVKPNWPMPPVPGTGRYLPPSITVYSAGASGDAAPVRVIEGSKTQLNWPTGLAFHPDRGELFVGNDMGHSVLVFRADASGNVSPIRTLQGPKTGIRNPTGVFVDTKNDELWVANFGNHSLSVYPMTAEGDTAPLRTIRSSPAGRAALMIGNPGAIDYDTKRKQILVPN